MRKKVSFSNSAESSESGSLQKDFGFVGDPFQVFVDVSLIFIWNGFNKLSERVIRNVLFNQFHYEALAAKCFVIMPTSQYKLTTFLVNFICVIFYPFSFDVGDLDLNRLSEKFKRVLVLVLLKINTPQIIHAAAQFFLIV